MKKKPTVESDRPRSVVAGIRGTPEQVASWQKAAAKSKRSLSSWGAIALDAAAQKCD
jgi:hypothetical protein